MITSSNELIDLVEKARSVDAVALDTEFIWNRTYFPKLGLLQLALSDEECYLIDPLAISDLSPFGELLADQKVIKVLHDAPQDLAILHTATGVVPKNIFDTKLAAGFAGLPATLSLGNLISELLDISLPKTETRTNWLKRPLQKKQIEYALDDVRYLRAARIILINRIIGPEIKSWLQEELDIQSLPETYSKNNGINRYQKLRGAKSLDSKGVSILRELSLWRERTAKKIDRPRGHIIPDNVLLDISKKRITTLTGLENDTSISPKALSKWGHTLLKQVNAGLNIPEKQRPKLEKSIRLNKRNAKALEGLTEFINIKCKVQGIDPALIGNIAELKTLVNILNKSCRSQMVRQMDGWRKTFLKDYFRYAL